MLVALVAFQVDALSLKPNPKSKDWFSIYHIELLPKDTMDLESLAAASDNEYVPA